MSHLNPSMQPSEAEIRAIYTEGEAEVVSLVNQLLKRLNSLESEVKELQGRSNKNSYNSPIIVNFGILVTCGDLFGVDINVSVSQADVKLF